MRKLRLKVEDLGVESFETTYGSAPGQGTVHAHASEGPTQCVARCNTERCDPEESGLPQCDNTAYESCDLCTNDCEYPSEQADCSEGCTWVTGPGCYTEGSTCNCV